MRKKSILAQLGVKSLQTVNHGQISIARAIQACALSAILASGIAMQGASDLPDYAAAMSAPGQTVHYDPALGTTGFLALAFDTETGKAGYIGSGAYRLPDRFRQDLESEISAVNSQAEIAGSWDLYFASRLTCLYLSEDPHERQVANAVLAYMSEHTEHAPADLPKPAYYTRSKAVEIDSARQLFAMADAMSEALISGGKNRITRTAAEAALARVTGEPDEFIAAFNVAAGVSPNQDGPQDILPLVEKAIDVEANRLSLQSMSGQMFGIPEVAEGPAGEAIILSRRVGKPIEVRVHKGNFDDYYNTANTEPTDETRYSQIKTGFDLSPGLAIEGRGVILSRIPMPGEKSAALPEIRYSVREAGNNQQLEVVDTIIEDDNFSVSM